VVGEDGDLVGVEAVGGGFDGKFPLPPLSPEARERGEKSSRAGTTD
jgi:hypothetical protein